MIVSRILQALFLLGLIGVTACSDEVGTAWPTPEPEPDMAVDVGSDVEVDLPPDDMSEELEPPRVAVAVETDVLSSEVQAGDVIEVTCRLLDAQETEIPAAPTDFVIDYSPPGNVLMDAGVATAARVGLVTVRCAHPMLGIIDPTPAQVNVIAGPPHTVVTSVSKSQVVAGQSFQVSCEVFDALGNQLPEVDPTIVITPTGAGQEVDDGEVTIRVADVYDVACSVDGASNVQAKFVEVIPARPASLVIAVVPNQQVYAVGQVVQLSYIVSDEFGNIIPNASVSVTSAPGGEPFGAGRFRYTQEGTYTLAAQVTEPTSNGQTLRQEATIVVNSSGPSINCGTPLDGSMVNIAPGSSLPFTGSVGDVNGVASVSVNGSGVVVAADGSFTRSVPVRFGINFVEVTARDVFGEENTKTCTFLATNNWASESGFLSNSVLLALLQDAIDDGSPADIDSLNDLLYRVLTSQGLVNQLKQTLSASNPLKPSSCDQTVLGVCVLRSEVTYQDLQVNGPNSSTLTLVNGGLRSTIEIKNLRIRIRVKGQVAGIPYDTSGWVTVSSLGLALILDVSLQAGRPKVTVRPNATTVSVGSVSTSFDGLDGGIVNIIVSLFNGTIRNLLANTVRGFVETSFNEVLDGVLGSLDITSLGTSFDVPKLDGSGTITLQFGVNFTDVDITTQRARFGIGTRLTPSNIQVAVNSLGVPLPPGPIPMDPPIAAGSSVRVAVYMGVMNQAFHALWRGGFLNATLGGTTIGGGLPAGVSAQIQTLLPPVIENLSNGEARLMLGAMNLNLVYPGIFDQGIALTVGANATTSVTLVGDELRFGNLQIEQLYFSTDATTLDSTTKAILENFLLNLLQSVINNSLNNALPALPIPSFELPQSLSQYGIPGGQNLGIQTSSYQQTLSQYLLHGTFAVFP